MSRPTFTVIVPTYRRPDKLGLCLQSLAAQDLPRSDYEIVVVDDASTQAGEGVVAANLDRVAYRRLGQHGLGAAAARNRGASVAEGRYFAFIDDDCRAAPDWLSTLAQEIRGHDEATLIGGRVVNELQDDVFASASQALMDFLYEQFNHVHGQAGLLMSNNLCACADAFRKIGGFDPTFSGAGGEDRELCLRWRRAGHRLVYVPEAVVYHRHDMNLVTFARQHVAYGRGAAVLRRLAVEQGHAAISMERASFYWKLLGHTRRAPGTRRPRTTSFLFAISQLATAVGYFQVALNRGKGRRGRGA
jgi:GT2 family glycosyltransferase